MKDVMVDLETLGLEPGSVIVSIGAVKFDPAKGVLGDTFYRVINISDACAHGLTMDPKTVGWWMSQSEAARDMFNVPNIPLYDALYRFSGFLDDEKVRVWGNGSDFDNVLLQHAYKVCNLPVPWKFYNNRCYRTVRSLAPNVKLERQGTHHNALDDAIYQAQTLCAVYKELSSVTAQIGGVPHPSEKII